MAKRTHRSKKSAKKARKGHGKKARAMELGMLKAEKRTRHRGGKRKAKRTRKRR